MKINLITMTRNITPSYNVRSFWIKTFIFVSRSILNGKIPGTLELNSGKKLPLKNEIKPIVLIFILE